jgi:hypothetical protein
VLEEGMRDEYRF